MMLNKNIAKHIRDIHFGGNWTGVNYREVLSDISLNEANEKIESLNTIAILVYHVHYYIHVVIKVLNGEALNAKDKHSFEGPEIKTIKDWEELVALFLKEAEEFAQLVENLDSSKFEEVFEDEKYGNYFRNIVGIIEHCHYHLGQIVVIKKLLRNGKTQG